MICQNAMFTVVCPALRTYLMCYGMLHSTAPPLNISYSRNLRTFRRNLIPLTTGQINVDKLNIVHVPWRSRDRAVGIATHYELDGPRIEFQCGRDFPHPSRLALRFTQPYKTGTGSFLGLMRSGRGVEHPSSSSTEVKERVELYLYFPSKTSCPVLG
jgi:hypothetical protein